MYRNFTEHVWKVFCFDSKTSKSFLFIHENVEKNMSWIQKHSKNISFRPKTFEKFLKLLQDIREVSKFHANYAGSIVSVHKIFEHIVFVTNLKKYLI